MNRTPNGQPLRVCVCTSVPAAVEPRAPRHAATLAALPEVASVVFVDCAPMGEEPRRIQALAGNEKLSWVSNRFATRVTAPVRLALERLRQRVEQLQFRVTGRIGIGALSTRAIGLEPLLRQAAADVYLAHNIETLPVAALVARQRGAMLMFDSMEFHSDMGDGQTPWERRLVQTLERRCLPGCALVLASSAEVADALAETYGIRRPLPLDNVPLTEPTLAPKPTGGLQLYWRNGVVGLGQRGLEDALMALTQLPAEVTLHLQGRMPTDGGAEMRARIQALGLTARVVFHPPYAPEEAVREAARHHVGLCLERRGCRNHDLTTSNKIFDYHMAGLAVVASDLPGLRGVIRRSQGGDLFEPGNVDDLVLKLRRLATDQEHRQRLATRARAFALAEGNRETEMRKLAVAFAAVCAARRST